MTDSRRASPPGERWGASTSLARSRSSGASADPMKWGHWMARDALEGAAHRRGPPGQLPRRQDPRPAPPTRRFARFRTVPTWSSWPSPRAASRRRWTTRSRREPGRWWRSPPASARAGRRAAPASEPWPKGCGRPGAVMLGPNCLGVADTGAGLGLGLGAAHRRGRSGSSARAATSPLELALLAARGRARLLPGRVDRQPGRPRGRRPGRRARRHRPTQVIALYVEDFRDGRTLAEAMHRGRQAGDRSWRPAPAPPARGPRRRTPGRWSATSPPSTPPAARPGRSGSPRSAEMIDVAQVAAGGALAPRGRGSRSSPTAAGTGDRRRPRRPRRPRAPDAERGASASGSLGQLPGRPVAENPIDLAGAGEQDLDELRAGDRGARRLRARSTRSSSPGTSAATASTRARRRTPASARPRSPGGWRRAAAEAGCRCSPTRCIWASAPGRRPARCRRAGLFATIDAAIGRPRPGASRRRRAQPGAIRAAPAARAGRSRAMATGSRGSVLGGRHPAGERSTGREPRRGPRRGGGARLSGRR